VSTRASTIASPRGPRDARVGLAFRLWFAVVGLFALWVGVWGYLAPAEVGRALPWTVPPLHARFIASMYLAGFVAMAASLFAPRLADVRIAVALATLWTGALMLVSLLRLAQFDFAKPQVWFWMGAYALFPLAGAWLYFGAGAARAAVPRRRDPWLVALGAASLLLAAALFTVPAHISAGVWPWPVSALLAHIYAGPFFAWGVCALMLAREAVPEARRIVLVSLLCFALLALLASLLHLPLFRFGGAAAWVWFAALSGTAAIAAIRLRQGRGEPAR